MGLLGPSRGSSETPGSSPGGLLVAHRSFPQRSWELLGVSWGPSAALGSPLGPLVASKWSSGSPKIGSWETPKSEFQINIQNICFIYKYYLFYYVFWHDSMVFYSVFSALPYVLKKFALSRRNVFVLRSMRISCVLLLSRLDLLVFYCVLGGRAYLRIFCRFYAKSWICTNCCVFRTYIHYFCVFYSLLGHDSSSFTVFPASL